MSTATIPHEPAWAPAPKACSGCAVTPDRILIAEGHRRNSLPRIFFAVILVFLPVLLLPFALMIGCLAYLHLRAMGATNLKTLRDFLPDRRSHRYTLKTQVIPRGRVHPTAFYTRLRLYWILNCTWYCPFSVALFEWLSYLTKAIENWWCPFHHGRKSTYDTARLDASYWHSTENEGLLDPDDRDNPIWCAKADSRSGADTPPEARGSAAEAQRLGQGPALSVRRT